MNLAKPSFLSAPSAAALCGVTRNTICNWIRQGLLDSYHTVGGKNLIRPNDLIAFMESHSMYVPGALKDFAEKETPAAEGGNGATEAPEAAILVVDDVPAARRLASAVLARLGMPVLQAESGYEALHLLLKHPEVALVVLDVVMPGKNGAETLVEMRRQNRHMPVLVVTGYANGHTDALFQSCRPEAILAKPYKPAELIETASALLKEG